MFKMYYMLDKISGKVSMNYQMWEYDCFKYDLGFIII